MQHYAFLVDDGHFDRAYERLVSTGVEHWSDPQMTRPDETNTTTAAEGCTSKTLRAMRLN